MPCECGEGYAGGALDFARRASNGAEKPELIQIRTSAAVARQCFRTVAIVCAVWFFASHHAAAQDAPPLLRVQVLNGKTGRPITNQRLLLERPGGLSLAGEHAIPSETTDGEGYVSIPNLDASVPDVKILVDFHRPCSKLGVHKFSLVKVRVAGIVSENSCKPRISLYPQPGTLIFFVRKETMLEKMRH